MDQKPSVGRIVHYVSHGTPVRPDGSQAFASVCRAAIITEVPPQDEQLAPRLVSLCVLNPTGQFFNENVPYGAVGVDATSSPQEHAYHPGSWHWPERV